MKKLIKLMIDDRVFARMISIILKSSSYELIAADEDEPEAVILTDRADFVSPNGETVLYLLRYCDDGSVKNLLIRPFLSEDLLRTIAELTGDAETAKRTSGGKTKNEPRFDRKNRRVMLGREAVTLTEKEFLLFSLLHDNKGRIVSDEEINEKVWKNEVAEGSNITAVYINYLRKKIEEPLGRKYFFRVRGKGYKIG